MTTGRLGCFPFCPGAVQALILALKASAGAVRWEAARGLRAYGVDAEPAVPALRALLDDRYESVRESVGGALLSLTGSLGAYPSSVFGSTHSIVWRDRNLATPSAFGCAFASG